MSEFLCICKSLKELPDISKCNTSNVNNMTAIFCDCISLKELPDISKWNTNNLVDIKWIFSNWKIFHFFQISPLGIHLN